MGNAMSAMSREEREELRCTVTKGQTVLLDIPVPSHGDLARLVAFVLDCEVNGPQSVEIDVLAAAHRVLKTL